MGGVEVREEGDHRAASVDEQRRVFSSASEMSCVPGVPVPTAEACANCGKEGSDAIKLKNCTACFLVKYCSVDCQKIHRKKHKKACKKRVAELKDEKLYGQGHERAEGDFCPLCFLAIPFPVAGHAQIFICCMKRVCNGCCLAADKSGLGNICPFCRTPLAKNDNEVIGMVQKRVDARDPEAISHLGDIYNHGEYGLEKNVSRAFELWSEAAELGSASALAKIGTLSYHGDGVAHDEAKSIHCWEAAAMKGDIGSRHSLGGVELIKGNYDRAVRHFFISAKMGIKESLDEIKKMFALGLATKAQYAETLKGYQDAVEEMKSPQREEAAKFGY
ncbi:hypothetical protein THAOC_37554 [Thalassiosira oceanica]|uniref:MYND-type domain-containing protein n=1 Tax=Thalassiosira oceanica TaxID=159749 RepID=K0RBP1_THAOC|nr:hypothetical protein THAOC_37554 [Thalassiosira oceanica]|eukprot:EJK43952.1 hypothetical protein THAOC_37554 [Thalassiosira oceanica]